MGDRRHVCIVTSAHPSDDVRVGTRIATSLLESGYRVTWVGPAVSDFQAEVVGRHDEVDYRLFPSSRSRIDRLTAARKALGIAGDVADVDWWYAPDPDTARGIVRLGQKLGGRTIFDVHENYHGGLLSRWFLGTPPAAVREALRRQIAWTCARIDLVIGVSKAVLTPYTRPDDTTLVVRNCAPAWFARKLLNGERTTENVVSIMHGKLASANGSSCVIEAAELLPADVARLVSIQMLEQHGADNGSFMRAVRGRVASLAEEPVNLRPSVSHEEMAHLMAECSVGLISYQRDLGLESLPNRLFEYMAAGLAILAPSYSSEIVSILESELIGIHADFEDPKAVAAALTWLVEHPAEVAAMGDRARSAFLRTYNWDAEAQKLVEKMRSMES